MTLHDFWKSDVSFCWSLEDINFYHLISTFPYFLRVQLLCARVYPILSLHYDRNNMAVHFHKHPTAVATALKKFLISSNHSNFPEICLKFRFLFMLVGIDIDTGYWWHYSRSAIQSESMLEIIESTSQKIN